MKTLASCTPTEFIRQTVRIRRAVEKWLTDTDILNIRKRVPDFDEDATPDQRKEAMQRQALANFDAIFDAMFEDHPEETLEVLALVCFVEPADVDAHPVSEYLAAVNEVLNDSAVLSFFSSLVRLGQMSG